MKYLGHKKIRLNYTVAHIETDTLFKINFKYINSLLQLFITTFVYES